MKRYFSLLLLIVLLNPRTTNAQWRFGVIGGVNYSGINPYTNQYYDGGSSATTFHKEFFMYRFNAGLQFDFKLGKALHFRPDLLYTQKGWTDHSISGLNQSTPLEIYTYKVNYVETPLNIIYGTPLGNGKVFIGGGPYVAYGIGGKFANKPFGADWIYGDIVFDKPLTTYPPPPKIGIKRWDYGVNGLIGYEFNFGLTLDLRYELGIPTVYYKNDIDQILGGTKYDVFSLNVGFLLTRKRTR